MPLPIVLPAGLQSLGLGAIPAAKVVAYAAALALFGVLYAVLRRLGCSRLVSVGLVGAVLVTDTGVAAATSLHFDSLAVAFQLAAVAVVAWSRRPWPTAGAGVLCALAFLSKLSAVWAPLAICIWLAWRERARLAPFLGGLVPALAAGLVLFQVASHGRLTRNVLALTLSGYSGGYGTDEAAGGPRLAVAQLLTYVPNAEVAWALVPFAVAGVVLAARRRALSVWDVALATSFVNVLVVLGDDGADFNHLIDFAVLVAVCAGALWARTERDSLIRVALAAVVVAIGGAALARNVVPPLHGTASYPTRPLAGHVVRGESLLSDDPYASVSLGRRPVVLDLFMLQRFGRDHPEWIEALRKRVAAGEFDVIALRFSLSQFEAGGFFGPRVNAAIRSTYRFRRRVGQYWLYGPRVSRPSATS
jgi:hypothetical protein